MNHKPLLQQARQSAADYFGSIARPDLAEVVIAGGGDDFDEVRAAAQALSLQAERIARYEQALRQYADAEFWNEDLPGGALSSHDRGEMARNVLAGRSPFYHRD
jgi:hypothetical protein